MASARMTAEGQFTMPKSVRDRLSLKPGDRIDFIEGEGEVVVRVHRGPRAVELAGILGQAKAPLGSCEDIDEAIGKAIAEDDLRIRRQWRDGRE